MTHYLADWKARDHNLTMWVDEWNNLVDGFDADGMAKQLQAVGAHYTRSPSSRIPAAILRRIQSVTV